MKTVAALALLLSLAVPVKGDSLPDAPKPKVEVKREVKKPGLLRRILNDKRAMTLAGIHTAAATTDTISTVHWERRNKGGIEVGYPFHGGRPGVPAMVAEAVIEVGAAAFLAHEMRSSRFKVVRVLSFVPQSACIATHTAGARRNYVLY